MQPSLGPAEDTSQPFVGRQRERARLDAALAEALAGCGRVVMLVGEPGIGKTRTAEYLAFAARRRNATVLVGRCHEGAGAPVYWPWRLLVRSYARRVARESLAEDLGTGAADVARVVDDLQRILPNLPALSATMEPDEARFRFFDAFTRFLCAIARRHPLVLILDDLHWADLGSLQLLQFLAREMSDAALLIVGTYREVEVTGDDAKAEVLGSLSRERIFERLALQGLSDDETRTLLTAIVGSPPTEELLRALHARTEGNPFFLTEVARHMGEQQTQAYDRTRAGRAEAPPIPESVRAVVRQRLRRLQPQTLRLLKMAAVIGREFELTVLASTLESDRQALLPLVVEAASAGILQPPAPAATRARFTHALVRDVLYDALPADERSTAHRSVGLALERHWHLDWDDHAGELAVHALASAAVGDAGRAVNYAVRAAERAIAQVAYDEATHWYRRALDALALEKPSDAARTCRLLLALGGAQAAASNVKEMRETFRRAADLARRLGDAEAFAEAAIGFARVPLMDGIVDPPTIDLLEEALATLQAADSALRAGALSMLAYALQHAPGTQDRRKSLCLEARQIAHRLGDLRTLARTLYDQHNALFAPETVEERFDAANELLLLAQQTDDRPMLVRARYCRIIDLLEMGRLPECDAEIDALGRLAEELREPWHFWYTTWFRATRATMEGRFDAGEELAQRAFSHGERVAPDLALQVLGVQISMLRALQGRWAEMAPSIRALVEQFPATAAWRCALAYHCCELDEGDEARRHFEILARDDFAAIPHDGSWFVSLSQLVDVCAYLEDAGRAAVLYEQLLPFAGRLMVVNSALACSGVGTRFLGVLATTMGHWRDAESHLHHALEFHRRRGMRPWVAQTLYDYARMLAARDAPAFPAAAVAALREAGELADALGMAGLATKVAALRATAAVHDTTTCASEPRVVAACVFRKEDDFWTVAYEGCVCRLKDARGMQYLVHLLRHPGRQFHVTELLALAGGAAPADAAPDGSSVRAGSAALPSLDDQARRAYRQRLIEVQEDLAEAERNNDTGAADRAHAERELLTREIAGAVRGSDAGERARSSITKRVKAALATIRAAHPGLAHHLGATVKTGYFCSYSPDPRHPIDWQT